MCRHKTFEQKIGHYDGGCWGGKGAGIIEQFSTDHETGLMGFRFVGSHITKKSWISYLFSVKRHFRVFG